MAFGNGDPVFFGPVVRKKNRPFPGSRAHGRLWRLCLFNILNTPPNSLIFQNMKPITLILGALILSGCALSQKPKDTDSKKEETKKRSQPMTPQKAGESTTTASGLKYIDTQEGTGPSPSKGQTCFRCVPPFPVQSRGTGSHVNICLPAQVRG